MTESIEEDQTDMSDLPRQFTQELWDEAEGLSDLLSLVKAGEPWQISTPLLLGLVGYERRGRRAVSRIEGALRERGLAVSPPIKLADYYGSIVISDSRDERPHRNVAGLPVSALNKSDQTLFYAGPEWSLEKVETTMIMHEFSQLPILTSKRDQLKGTATWASIAAARRNGKADTAKDAKVEGYFVAESSADLIDLVPRIIEDEFIYYRDPSGAIVGILTASDLAGAFQLNAGPYIRVGEIEARIRQILDKLPLPTLRKFLKDQDVADFNGASDMTFGEYVKTLGDEKVWTSLDLPFDQGACVNTLEKVRVVRNAIMHFGEPVDDASARAIDHTLNWLRLVGDE